MKYIVIDADIINSRSKHFTKNIFSKQMNLLNESFKQHVYVPFSILKGDEIQGVLELDAPIFQIIRFLKAMFMPYNLRIGIGIDEIYQEDEEISSKNSWELNGPAFFKARDAIDLMDEGKGKKNFSYFVYFKTGNDKLDYRISLIYSYIDDDLKKWKKEIYDIIFLEEQGLIHSDIAEAILKSNKKSVTDVEILKMRINVTKKILRSNWYKIKQTETMLNEMLREENYL